MRRALILTFGLAALLALALIWQHHAQIIAWAATMQREAQNGLARSLQALRAGDPGALARLMGLCLAYGFLHAVGPGHGKFLVGAYSTSRSVPLGRLAFATIAASLGQAVTAVTLVLGGIGIFALTRQQLTGLAETTLTQLSSLSILMIGLWLVLRGTMRSVEALAPRPVPADTGSHHQHHDHDQGHCASCGHAHAPSPQKVAAASNWRELASVILAIAIRPCSGAILLLVLTWQMNILGAGIAGAFAMATGTAILTLLVAVMGSALRNGVMSGPAGSTALRTIGAALEIVAGLTVVLLAGGALGLI